MPTKKILYELDLSRWEEGADFTVANGTKRRLVGIIAAFCLVIFIPFTVHNYISARWPLLVANLLFLAAFIPSMWFLFRRAKPLPNIVIVLVTALLIFATALPIAYHGLVSVLWAFTITTAFYFLLSRHLAFAMSMTVLVCYSLVSFISLDVYPAIRVLIALTVNFYLVSLLARKIGDAQYLLAEVANKDPMTGALNRRLLDDYLNASIHQRTVKNVDSVVAIFDIDNFKTINDNRGHQAGDLAIIELVKLIKKNCRAEDLVFRIGGDEILLLIRNVEVQQAEEMLERIRAQVQRSQVIGTTSSIGAVISQKAKDFNVWIKLADQALYRAKQGGRNRLVMVR